MLLDAAGIRLIPWPLPAAPAALNAVSVSSSQINLSWNAVSVSAVDTLTRYYIYRNGAYLTSVNNQTTVYADTGLASSTTYTYNVAAVGAHGNIGALSNTAAAGTSGSSSGGQDFPRIGKVSNAGDQSYGQNSTPGFISYTASGPGTAAYNAIQNLASYDILYGLGGSFEGWQAANRNKQNLVTAFKAGGNFPILHNANGCLYVFPYAIINESINASTGSGYQTLTNIIIANNWWVYTLPGATGTTVASPFGSGLFEVNYTYAWPLAVGSAAVDQPICGHVYGGLSNGQSAAATAATYFTSALLTLNPQDPRFLSLTNGAAPNADGLFWDNCFVFPNGGGNVNPLSVSWDGVSLQLNSAFAAYPAGASSLLARGQFYLFQTMQAYLALCNPGKTYLNIGNFGSYADTTTYGNTHAITSGAMDNVLHGGMLENIMGAGPPSSQSFRTFSQVLTNYYYGMDWCKAPKLVGVGVRLPATDGSTTATFTIGGVPVTVTTGTALEYQVMRAGLTFTLLDDGYFVPGSANYNYSVERWYDEFGDDSLTQVNVKRRYLGQPLTGRPTSAMFNIGPVGLWGRQFANGIALFNPWGNGPQTLTAAQLGGVWYNLNGSQQPLVNDGTVFTSYTFADFDGLILLNTQAAVTPLTITTLSPLTQAITGTIYSKSLAASGGFPPYTWSLVSAAPNSGSWVNLSSSGVVSGTPSVVETETIVVKVTDAASASVTKSFSLQVVAAPLVITTGSPLAAATVGSAYSATIAGTGGVQPYTWSVIANAPNTGGWSSINPSTGLLSGTPSTAETESITVKLQDSVGSSITKVFSLTVNAQASHPAFFQNFDSLTPGGSGGLNSTDCTVDNSRSFSSPNSGKCSVALGGFSVGAAQTLSTITPGQGDEVWFRVRTFFPTGFILNSNPHLKFLRIDTGAPPGGHGTHIDWYVTAVGQNGQPNGYFNFIYEGVQSWLFTPDATLPNGIVNNQWQTFEIYYLLHSVASSSIIRLWRDGNLICDTSANIPAGVGQRATLSDPTTIVGNLQGNQAQGFMHVTYWNGGSPATQSWNIDDFTIYTSLTGRPTGVDAHGNTFIGMS